MDVQASLDSNIWHVSKLIDRYLDGGHPQGWWCQTQAISSGILGTLLSFSDVRSPANSLVAEGRYCRMLGLQ